MMEDLDISDKVGSEDKNLGILANTDPSDVLADRMICMAGRAG